MSNVTFKLNRAGVREVLKSDGVQNTCRSMANSALARCGDGYVVHDVNYPERRGAAVAAATIKAARDNMKNNTLLKAVSG